MFKNKLQKHLLTHKTIKASMDEGKLNEAQLTTLIDEAHARALPLLQRQAWGAFFMANNEWIEMLEKDVLSNLKSNQTALKL